MKALLWVEVEVATVGVLTVEAVPVDARSLLIVEATRVAIPRRLPATTLLRGTVAAAAVMTHHLDTAAIVSALRLVVAAVVVVAAAIPTTVELAVADATGPRLPAGFPLPWMIMPLRAVEPPDMEVVGMTTLLPDADTTTILDTTEEVVTVPTARAEVEDAMKTLGATLARLREVAVQGPLLPRGVHHPPEEATRSTTAVGISEPSTAGFENVPTGPKSHRSNVNGSGGGSNYRSRAE